MAEETDQNVSHQWREGFFLGLQWIIGGLLGGAALGIFMGDIIFYGIGFVFGFLIVFLWTSYFKYGR